MTDSVKRIIVVGLGQIGTSIALGLRRKGVEMIAVDTDPHHLEIAQKRGIRCYRSEETGDILLFDLKESDLVILAVPVLSICRYLEILPPGPLIMDVGSTKEKPMAVAARRGLRFIGAHPVAGTEKSGPEAGNPKLFREKPCFLTRSRRSDPVDQRTVRDLWGQLGARVRWINPRSHDRLFAEISHLPHAVSFAFARVVLPLLHDDPVQKWAEGSFRDMTRVASSPVAVWTDIFLTNRSSLLRLLNRMIAELTRLKGLIVARDLASLRRWVAHAKRLKEGLR